MAVVTTTPVTSAAVVTTETAVTAASTTAEIQQAADHAPSLWPLYGPTQGTNISSVECNNQNGLHICREVMCTSPAIRQPLGECLYYPTHVLSIAPWIISEPGWESCAHHCSPVLQHKLL